jgi:endogenous inhibitor of DNA gyrase (YacG/DUF329 family)
MAGAIFRSAPTATDLIVMERRRPGPAASTHVKCPHCQTMVLLDPAKMHLRDIGAELPCPRCGSHVPARRSDAFGSGPDGIWTLACYADDGSDEEPPPRGLRGLLHRKPRQT